MKLVKYDHERRIYTIDFNFDEVIDLILVCRDDMCKFSWRDCPGTVTAMEELAKFADTLEDIMSTGSSKYLEEHPPLPYPQQATETAWKDVLRETQWGAGGKFSVRNGKDEEEFFCGKMDGYTFQVPKEIVPNRDETETTIYWASKTKFNSPEGRGELSDIMTWFYVDRIKASLNCLLKDREGVMIK